MHRRPLGDTCESGPLKTLVDEALLHTHQCLEEAIACAVHAGIQSALSSLENLHYALGRLFLSAEDAIKIRANGLGSIRPGWRVICSKSAQLAKISSPTNHYFADCGPFFLVVRRSF